MNLSRTSKKIISDVVSIPTAPFHEHKVIAYVTKFCLRHGFKLKQDSAGNIFIRYKRAPARQPVIFTAHMDHPGFEVLKVDGLFADIGILGGVKKKFLKTARVVISSGDKLVKGKVVKRVNKSWMSKPIYRVKTKRKVSEGDFGYYDLVGAEFKKDLIHTKSADNLAGTALLLDLLLKLKKARARADVTVVLTRAEEVGFAGCIYAADDGCLSKKVPLIVLETSDAIGGRVKINDGPVIRVGDKQSGFIPEVDAWMHMVALDILKESKDFKFQRALLAGGRCEASAYILKGYLVGGMAFPLGNYHNNGPKGYAPEYIGTKDYAWLLEFFFKLSQSENYKTAFKKKKKELWDNYNKWKNKF